MTVSGPRRLARDPRQQKLCVIAGVGLAVLVVAALAVVFVLPPALDTQNSPPTRTTSADIPAVTALPVRPSKPVNTKAPQKDPLQEQQRKTAEGLLADALRKQAALESEGVKVWGAVKLETSYPEVQETLADANVKFDTADYESAAAAFRKVISLLDTLAAQKDERYRLAMAKGNSALASDNAEGARSAFEIALALRPQDPQAGAGLARAQSLPEVLSLMEQGRRLDISGDLDGAYKSYAAAASLDGAYPPARTEAERTARLIAERDYAQSVSDAIRALDNGMFSDASLALKRARQIRPGTPEIRDLAARLTQDQKAVAIRNLSRRARQASVEENWEKAFSLYKRVLAIDKTVGDAVRGLRQSERMVRLHGQIDTYLGDPDRLSSDGPLKHARLVRDAAIAVDNPGPGLTRKAERLTELIETASRPRPVVLKSDGETAVTIYRVARFGTFTEKRLELRPGKYTAVGSRPGYRDVRVEFRVSHGGEPILLDVRCTERI